MKKLYFFVLILSLFRGAPALSARLGCTSMCIATDKNARKGIDNKGKLVDFSYPSGKDYKGMEAIKQRKGIAQVFACEDYCGGPYGTTHFSFQDGCNTRGQSCNCPGRGKVGTCTWSGNTLRCSKCAEGCTNLCLGGKRGGRYDFGTGAKDHKAVETIDKQHHGGNDWARSCIDYCSYHTSKDGCKWSGQGCSCNGEGYTKCPGSTNSYGQCTVTIKCAQGNCRVHNGTIHCHCPMHSIFNDSYDYGSCKGPERISDNF